MNKGDYIVCRYLGASGDVIAGRVISIRAGKAKVKNLLTNAESVRSLAIVERRNIVVPRSKAIAVREIFDKKNKLAARRAAVAAAKVVKAEKAAKPAKKVKKKVKA